jgi:hypothetical protein
MHEREAPRLRRQLPRVCVVADAGGLEAAGAGHHEAARQHLVRGALVDRLRFTGEERFVDLQTVRLDDLTVDDGLVAAVKGAIRDDES